jgi:hypothetical protein
MTIGYTVPEIRRLLGALILTVLRTRAGLGMVTLASPTPAPGQNQPLPPTRIPAITAVAVPVRLRLGPPSRMVELVFSL